jgi:hypothetical protein
MKILTAPTVVSKHCSVMKNPPWKERENDWFPSCLPLWFREEGERKTLSEKVKEYDMAISAGQKEYL